MTDHNSLLALVADERKGFIKIPNLLFDALMCAQITSTQKDICAFILRHTYGWNRREVPISITEFCLMFSADKSWISKQLNDLMKKNIILKTRLNTDQKSIFKINHNVNEWDRNCLNLDQLQAMQSYRPTVIARRVISNTTDGFGSSTTEGLVSTTTGGLVSTTTGGLVSTTTGGLVSTTTGGLVSTTTPEGDPTLQQPQSHPPLNTLLNTNIKTIFKNSENLSNLNYECYSLANLLLEKAIKNNPELQMPDLHEWALIIEKMIVDEQRRPEDIKKAILFAHESDFWSSNIINAHRLDTQFELLNSQRVRKEKDDLKKKKTHYDEYEIFVGV